MRTAVMKQSMGKRVPFLSVIHKQDHLPFTQMSKASMVGMYVPVLT